MIELNPKRSDEPVWWGLFGAGGTWFAMISPVTILILGILAPLGLLSDDALSYERVSSFVTSFIGALFTIGTLSLPMWHAMHRIHHGLHDFKIKAGTFGKLACYSTAYLFTVMPIIFILMI